MSSVRHGLPVALDAVMARGLAKRPGERYGSCAEFADAVRAALTGAAHPSLPRAQVAGAYPSGPHAHPSGPHLRPPGFDQSASGPFVRAAGAMQAPMATGHGQPIVAQAPVSAATGAARSIDAGAVRSRKRWVIGLSVAAALVVVAALTGVIVSNSPADDEPTAIQAISEEFPNMVPDNDLGLGFNGHTCMSQDPSRGRELWKGQQADGPDLGQWSGAWHCYDGRTDYYLLKYDHEQDLHQVLDAMKPIDITSDVNGSVIYENYHLAGKDPKEHAMVSGFPIPDRAQYLLYTTGKFKTPEEFMDWWKSLPLS
ncbi:hypothetical protein [Nocardia cyriacigeorgica]|uniref:hypothetical protein n=1 Tax=Nocardia cyriacigeorgica TaxID=135487 RepID=UPI002B4B3EDF|nr:hypothetical protein [Nocardia cyriacigeorgica]